MADLRNSNQNYTGLIPKYIGSAYDKVAAVAGAIDAIEEIAKSIEDGTFDYIADNMDIIKKVMEDIYEFRNIYYGILDDFPTVSPTGDMIDEGDLFYHRYEQQLYIYVGTTVTDECGNVSVVDGRWLPANSIEATTETIIVNFDQAANGVIQLRYPYIVGQHNIDVYVNNIIQISTITDPALGSYHETAGDTLTFVPGKIDDPHNGHRTLAESDEIYIVIGLNVATVEHNIEVRMARYVTQIPNEQIIILPKTDEEPNGMQYVPGDHNLEVYVKTNQHSREIQVVGIDYLELDAQRIQFLTPLPQYVEIVFKKGVVLSNLPIIPRVLMQEIKPTEMFYDEGQFWFNTSTGRMSILYLDADLKQWVDISEEHTVIHPDYEAPPPPPPVLTNATVFQPLQPEPALFAEGTLWFNTATGELNILYSDEGDRAPETGFGPSPQWVKVSTQ